RHESRWSDAADGVVAGVGDDDVAERIDSERRRMVELRVEAGDRRDGAVGAELANDVVARVGDVDVSGGVDGQSGRRVEWRCGGDRLDREIVRHLTDRVVAGV